MRFTESGVGVSNVALLASLAESTIRVAFKAHGRAQEEIGVA